MTRMKTAPHLIKDEVAKIIKIILGWYVLVSEANQNADLILRWGIG
jgi:hypothetical protein